jgi:hypothetical protein
LLNRTLSARSFGCTSGRHQELLVSVSNFFSYRNFLMATLGKNRNGLGWFAKAQ